MPDNPRMQAADAKAVVDRFVGHQRAMYAGGGIEPVADLLADDIVWHVPGRSPIAGDYRGRDAVIAYFENRRRLAGGAIAITGHGDLTGPDVTVHLADGHATLGGEERDWRTAGVYRVAHGKIAEAWLVPLDQEQFDRAWNTTRESPFVYTQRVRPQECAASTMLGHPRFLEFFEAAFIESWRHRFGRLDDSLGTDRRLTVAAVDVNYLGPVRADDDLRIEVSFDRITTRSIHVHYDAFVEDSPVARGRARYVCLDVASGLPTPLPASVSGHAPSE